jgi:hypothetical protein
MERGLTMLCHAILIGIVLYLAMLGFGQATRVAENRSILIAACALVYMILFGHGMPHW